MNEARRTPAIPDQFSKPSRKWSTIRIPTVTACLTVMLSLGMWFESPGASGAASPDGPVAGHAVTVESARPPSPSPSRSLRGALWRGVPARTTRDTLGSILHSRPRNATQDAVRPVVLVHGWRGLSDDGFRCSDGVARFHPDDPSDPDARMIRAAFGRLPDRLAEDRPVFLARYTTARTGTASLRTSAACLADQLADVQRQTGADAVDVVGFSMGGLVARAVLEQEDDGRSAMLLDRARGGAATPAQGTADDAEPVRIARLVTLGTPHTGVAPGLLVRLVAFFNLDNAPNGFLPCDADPGTCDLASDAMEVFNSGRTPPPDVPYDMVAGDRFAFTSLFLPGRDDGLVALVSGTGRGTAAGEHGASWKARAFHNRLIGEPHLVQHAGTMDCVLLRLSTADPEACVLEQTAEAGIAGRPHDPSAGTQPAMLPLRTTRITAGDTITMPVVIDGPSATVVASWGAGGHVEPLIYPPGSDVDAPIAGIGSKIRRRADGGGMAYWRLPDTAPLGTWTVQLHSGDGSAKESKIPPAELTMGSRTVLPRRAPGAVGSRAFANRTPSSEVERRRQRTLHAAAATSDAEVPVAVTGVLTSTLQLAVRGANYDMSGNALLLEATLRDGAEPIPDATVQARWHRPDGSRGTRLAPMVHAGNGIYLTVLFGEPLAHATQLDVTATGATSDGTRFERQATVFIQPDPRFTPPDHTLWLPRLSSGEALR